MKPVVMEVNGDRAVVLDGNGGFMKVRNRGYSVGQRLRRLPRASSAVLGRWAAVAAALVLLVAGGTVAYCTPYTQVSLDVNPSIELSLNLFDQVIDATPMNADGERILAQARALYGNLPGAVQAIVDELAAQGYIEPGSEADILLTAASRDQDRSQALLQSAVRTAEERTEQLKINANVIGECVNAELRQRAREYGVSPGKLMLAERYALSTGKPEEVDLKNWLNKPVKEMLREIAANGGEVSPKGPGTSNDNGQAGRPPEASSASPDATATAPANRNGNAGGDNENDKGHSGNGWTEGPEASPAPNPSPAPGATEPARERSRTGSPNPSPCQTDCPTPGPTDSAGQEPAQTESGNGYKGGK